MKFKFFLIYLLLFAGSCFAQDNLPAINKDTFFYAGINGILEDLPNNFKKYRGKEFFENNGVYYKRFASNYSLPNAAKSYITVMYKIMDSLRYTFHSCWYYPLKDSLTIREKADSIGKLITEGTYNCCQKIQTKDFSNKENYFRYFYTDGKKSGMLDVYENVYMEITIYKDYIKKGIKGFVIHLEIRAEMLPKGSN
jgi:hypothetical protein